ncbi:MAG: Fructose-bisphosphate aldolase [Candidatus Uhrbacteria bacterium GW2011_GWF2_39_13]|uniref:Fructose-bisphosphate aldolase n=1 Tax=Candidatus Uhrbacteria bacterium GW2011_GWF2_39_13 TaxID=1618995 RepID=A0A0G0MSS3_9BACT|nr:MAG: Fructose-bisphosphate aldolase [Candidatus Uhrbacteria bacterium GW2011_GWF2_39_13]
MTTQNLFLSRFFSTGPAIVVAFDHGMFDGPIKGVDKVNELPDRILPAVDGILMSPGMLKDIGLKLCGHRNSPMPIVRINWSTIYCFDFNYHSGDTVAAFTPQEAFKAGAQCVLISLSLQTGSQERDAKNIEVFRTLCGQAHELGLPVIGEYFPVDDEKLSPEQMHNEIKIGCRILYELGADVIKTFYTHKFKEVVDGCPTPILALGGKRLPTDLDALKFAKEEIDNGASGIVFGRNVIQSAKPLELQKALIDVLKGKLAPESAAKKYNLL